MPENPQPPPIPALSPFWTRERHADRRPFLLARAAIVRALRAWFADEDFLEVEAAALQVSPGNEAHLHAFATEIVGVDGRRTPRYLHTSPEFALKKLLAAGERRIVDFARVWRNREAGPLHANEFTLLEWYRAGEGYGRIAADCLAVVAEAAKAAGAATLAHGALAADPHAAPEHLTVVDAFRRHAGIDLAASIGAAGNDRDRLEADATAAGIRTAPDDTWSDIFSRVLSERVERKLGLGRMTVLSDYPASEAALARRKPADPRFAERFELYACGVELANGFGELTDPEEQRRRFVEEMDEKERLYGERYPLDEDFLAALAHMPDASGVALGLDRLVMLVTHAPRIDLVQWTPAEAGGDTP